jgi:formate hydrogenlyase subunit 3/multisubunit Na+/H+ antiporter MnhD subunit
VIACCLGGTTIAFLAADAVTLALGLTAACIAIAHGTSRLIPVPLLLLTAIVLLTPPGYAPRFDTIAAAPIDPGRATAAAALAIAAAGALTWQPAADRSWTRAALHVGVLIPFGLYVVLRVTADLAGSAAQSWWGSVLLLAGGITAVVHAWEAAATPNLDTAIGALMRRQAGLATTTVGLALIARTADLPGAATFALEATCLAAVAAATAGVLATLAAHTIGTSAGTYRLSALGGLVHPMPGTSTALAAGLLALSALPPTLGFAALWLSFQSILSAPRTGGLVAQLPLALGAAAIALSAALAIAASVRIVGIAILGRPRTPRGAGAAECQSPVRTTLLALAALSLLAGILPGPALWLLANPAIHAVTGLAANRGLGVLSVPGSNPTYLALPVLALIGLAATIPMRFLRRPRAPAKAVGPWTEGMELPVGLPFGDPAAQSTGAGFLPPLPAIPWPRLPAVPKPPALPATFGPWLLVIGFAALLLVLTVAQ